MTQLFTLYQKIYALGGPVVLLLIAVSILTLTVVLCKIWQFAGVWVGRYKGLLESVAAWDPCEHSPARAALDRSRSYLPPVIAMAFKSNAEAAQRVEAESRFARLERGMRFLDSAAPLAPLMGLFGMISTFQAHHRAGAQVDPSIHAGGNFVALLTTAVGFAVAMPTALILSWFEGRMDAERVLALRAIPKILLAQVEGLPVESAKSAACHA
ncbi:hypothetical protein P775_13640 [Puniceibacterium antarcticum]|uniref:MotA/TolQ/ExbB proton channel domain-containing protein n=1 Tax=Puniceibacterium antarcticum TaxID=1206336 RepID=A0A2G8RDR5_9RHOB|nr:MotA/TolQ/ExbB proton channel family protein [Puniceibacterium antarcticum]PIL19561.1 hypothetical protein P775_13640 [Puniceibacterium antarcticum]